MTETQSVLRLPAVPYEGNRFRWLDRRMNTPNVIFGAVVYDPGGICGPRIQRDFQLVVVHSGSCRVRLNEVEHELRVGTVYQFQPGGKEYFVFSPGKETHHSWCSIRSEFMPRSMQRSLLRAPFAVPHSEVFRLLQAAVFKLRAPRNNSRRDLVDQLGLCLFREFLNVSQEAHSGAQLEPAVRIFLHYVEDHFGEQDCLQAAHEAAGVSRNALIYKFHKEMGTTPGRYLWKFRGERGVAMLNETGHSISEIAYRCGFNDPFHFSKLVKQYVGYCPKKIRHQTWAEESTR